MSSWVRTAITPGAASAALLSQYRMRPLAIVSGRVPHGPGPIGHLGRVPGPWLAATLGEIVTAAARTDTFLGERYHRLARRRGKRRAMVAVGNSVLTIIWNLLSDPDSRYHDLGPGFYQSRLSKQRRERDLIRRLETLTAKAVTLQPRPEEQPAA